MSDELSTWASNQRALARALGLTIEEWLSALSAAGERKTGLTAAVVGAAMSEGLGLGVLDRVDGPALAESARALVDPAPPEKVKSPVLREAIRRSDELTQAVGKGAGRLKRRSRPDVPAAVRTSELEAARSAATATPDAPGEDES